MRFQNIEKVKIGVYIAYILAILSDAVSKNMKASSQYLSILAIVGFVALVCGLSPALAVATAPTLGNADSFAVLGGSAVTNTGTTVVTGDLGLSPGSSITGFPPGIVIGTNHTNDTSAGLAQIAATTAYNNLAGQTCDFGPFGPTDLAGQTLVPGVYCYSSSAENTGVLTLDAQGNNNAVWVFKMGSSLGTGPGSSVVVINGGQDCNVFWQVTSSATLDTTTKFVGTIIALTSITLNTGATVSGRALARNGAVTLDTNVITASVCAAPTPPPTLGKGFNPFTINETNNVSTLTITLSNPITSVATLTAPLIDNLPDNLTIANTPNAITTCGGTATVSATAGGPNVTLSSGSTIPAAIGTTPGTCTVTVDVAALHNGSYLNTLPANALQTNHGSNTLPAIATLTVVPLSGPPMLGKGFSPFTINLGGVSTLTIILFNPNTSVATLNLTFKRL